MKSSRWEAVERARRILGLPERVTRLEIQAAYRRCCRRLHPDNADQDVKAEAMAQLNEAYRLLMDLADSYRMLLKPSEDNMTDSEWWMHHFGQDPIWTGRHEE